ncbi:MAG: recombinase family protein [Lachnospiraceae bacterium]|nr:recombinase family protein [Lachnospiraceae bacterium]
MVQKALDKNYNAAIYLRLSKEDGDFSVSTDKKESNSIANQRKLITEYLKHYPEITLVAEYCDDGYTGTNFDRPNFQKMMEDVKQRKINCIVVKDLSRFGREYIEMGRYVEKIFPAMGVRFIAINDNYDSGLAEQAGNEIIIPFKNLINDSYSRDISIKVRTNLDIKRRNGEFVGTHVVYGYQRCEEDKNQLVIDQAVAPIVQSIFRMKMDGFSPTQIAEKLNRDGVPSPYEYKRLSGSKFKTGFKQQVVSSWGAVTIYRILKNEMYTGTLVQGKTSSPNYKVKNRTRKEESDWTRTENAHEAIITPATFDLVQKLMLEDSRSPSGDESVHLFSGKIFCQDCQGSMTRKRTTIAGKTYVYFICTANKQDKNVCNAHRIREQAVYDAVLAVIQSQVELALDLQLALEQLHGISWEERELERIRQRMKRQEEIITHNKQMETAIYEDFKAEIITLDEYHIFKEEFDKNIKEANEAITHLNSNRNQVRGGLTEQQSWLAQFKEYENIRELNRRIVVHFIERIEITADKEVSVVLNNADQFQAILEFLREYPEVGKEKVLPFAREVI